MVHKEKHMYIIHKYYYKNVQIDVTTQIENNKDTYVKSINGKDPFEIIGKIGKKYSSFKYSSLDNSFTQ
ncbi:hypothetical protein ENUP19_0101G0009 [Entamoeba nuttalli]|uniref:Uncharacterized protein n=1 Tax=Entamoeba nuttalli TaxID=412467 RepID=A0ABQ0DHH1_9EUKA